ncbi:hypothetical protein BDN70DRAFT_881586 [Pholiota conissans]|uniref:Uncharacterized protein n=1 Tax=Pholiota conissans TaxID=109636 RepID=A0A9P6CRJ7_9AGAR|nr:hypothetical protein BDN70DRAFT_881586 [Pholiota conissans]
MNQDGKSSAAPQGELNTENNLLSVVFLAYDIHGRRDEKADHYAVIRFSRSYEKVIQSIKERLGNECDFGDTLHIYAPILNNSGQWVWAKGGEKDWDLVIEQVLRTKRGLGVKHEKNYGGGYDFD